MEIKRSSKARTKTIVQFITSGEIGLPPGVSSEKGATSIRAQDSTTIIYAGIGEKRECTTSVLRTVAAKAAQRVIELKQSSVSCLIPASLCKSSADECALIDGFMLGSYRFTKYRSDPPPALTVLELVGSSCKPAVVQRQMAICNAVNYSRSLVNENASVMTPAKLVEEARILAKMEHISITVLDEKALIAKKLNLITAVGGGSATPPALIILEYRGNRSSSTKTAIVGKGITFDSGGQNLKPTGSIETMRCDMAGAAAVLGVFTACAQTRPPINLIGVIPAAHNALGSKAYFPGDIYTSYSGKTVEIWNTDAEGRLVLADAIAYCRDHYKPDCIIDLATLTGGILTALGELVAGLFSTSDALAAALFAAGEKSGERLWRFPLYTEYCDSLKGDLGDVRNTSKFKKGYASSITGAAFIREFVGNTPWAHLDIAGTAFNEGAQRGEIPQYGTGFGVRLLLTYLGVL